MSTRIASTCDYICTTINNLFSFYLLDDKSVFIKNNLLIGDIIPHLYKKELIKLIINFPHSLKEQQKIAKFFSLLDKQIELYEKKLNNYDLIYKYYLNKMFANNNKIPSLRFKGFDEEWINDKLLNMSLCINNLRFPLSSQQRKDKKGIYPYFGATGVVDYINDYKIDDQILMLAEDCGNYNKFKTDPIAYYYDGKCWINNHTHVLKSDGKNSLKYILYSIIHKDITKHLNGDSRPKLNKSELYKIDIVVTKNILEQQKIASFFDKINQLIEKTKQTIIHLNNQKKYYLKNMFI